MPEATIDQPEQQPQILERVLTRLKELHAASAEGRSDLERIQDGMRDLILGVTTLEAKQALIALRMHGIFEIADREKWGSDKLAKEIMSLRQEITTRIFSEHWFESTLSTPEHPIHAATYGTNMFRFDLRRSMTEHPTPERLREFGMIMFDVDGLKSFKDCTSHSETTRFLQGIVRILVNPLGPTRTRLEGRGISVIPMATGGDEFVLYLRGETPLTQQIIDETITSFQQDISGSEELRAFLNFDDGRKGERALIQYGFPSSAKRKAFAKLSPEARGRKLCEIRESLPEKFIPTIAGGGALLTDGIAFAVEKDEYDLQGPDETFQTLREKIVQATIEIAEHRQKKNKERDKQQRRIDDPKLYLFQTRGSEARMLQERVATLEAELSTTRAQLRATLQVQTEDGQPSS